MKESLKDWLRDWGVLVCALLMVVMLTLFVIVLHNNEAAIEQSHTNACHAQQLSDDALVTFLNRQIAISKRPSNPLATQAFMTNLQQSYDEAQIACLEGK